MHLFHSNADLSSSIVSKTLEYTGCATRAHSSRDSGADPSERNTRKQKAELLQVISGAACEILARRVQLFQTASMDVLEQPCRKSIFASDCGLLFIQRKHSCV